MASVVCSLSPFGISPKSKMQSAMSFDKLAKHYSWMECLLAGKHLHLCRTAFLDRARVARSILLVGEGHGRFLLELCRANPLAAITCVEASEGMIAVAKGRLRRRGIDDHSVQFHNMPIQGFETSGTFDLIATHFFLDCFEPSELALVIRKLSALLRPGGEWIISDFQVPAFGWRQIRARAVLALAYTFFRKATALSARELTCPRPYLAQSGLESVAKVTFNFDLIYAELWRRRRDECSPSLRLPRTSGGGEVNDIQPRKKSC
jgi:ubiquinone/menaquinone biosynthesis C-methylase UbiE